MRQFSQLSGRSEATVEKDKVTSRRGAIAVAFYSSIDKNLAQSFLVLISPSEAEISAFGFLLLCVFGLTASKGPLEELEIMLATYDFFPPKMTASMNCQSVAEISTFRCSAEPHGPLANYFDARDRVPATHDWLLVRRHLILSAMLLHQRDCTHHVNPARPL